MGDLPWLVLIIALCAAGVWSLEAEGPVRRSADGTVTVRPPVGRMLAHVFLGLLVGAVLGLFAVLGVSEGLSRWAGAALGLIGLYGPWIALKGVVELARARVIVTTTTLTVIPAFGPGTTLELGSISRAAVNWETHSNDTSTWQQRAGWQVAGHDPSGAPHVVIAPVWVPRRVAPWLPDSGEPA